jgi:hypothetical protein
MLAPDPLLLVVLLSLIQTLAPLLLSVLGYLANIMKLQLFRMIHKYWRLFQYSFILSLEVCSKSCGSLLTESFLLPCAFVAVDLAGGDREAEDHGHLHPAAQGSSTARRNIVSKFNGRASTLHYSVDKHIDVKVEFLSSTVFPSSRRKFDFYQCKTSIY